MKNQQPKDITCKKIAWTIRNFNNLTTNRLSSKVFTIGDTAWEVWLYPYGFQVDYLSIFLAVANPASLPTGWSIHAEYSLAVVNQVSNERFGGGVFDSQFQAYIDNWGFAWFMPLSTFRDPNRGYILNDKCIIEVEFFVVRSEGTMPLSHPAYPSLSKESDEVPTNSNGELVDFRDLGQIEKAFVPLLEEVCLWHPSLFERQKKRTRKFIEWAFTALGRVLQFLKTKKWKDMNEDACEHLQQLWEELETCRFDLNWLETHVQSALGMKAYMAKAEQVKKLKENLVVLETEMNKLRENVFGLETETNKLKEKLAHTEESVENVKKDLVKAEEGFEGRDLDTEIGYGNP